MDSGVWLKCVGQAIEGKYHLTEFLGAGSFGGVFRADTVVGDRLMRTVALKLINPPLADTPEQVDALRDKQLTELELNAMLDHPNLLRCYSVGEWELNGVEYLYLALELGAVSLEQRLLKGILDEHEARLLARMVAGALSYLHSYRGGLVHRDLKPANLLLANGQWKLSDLGTAHGLAGRRQQVTQAIGTANYAPPECYDGVVSPAWDIWSLGIMLIEALTGQLPYDADTTEELMQQVTGSGPRIPAGLPKPFNEVIPGCLKQEREKRLNAAQVLEAVADVGTSTGPLIARPVEPEPPAAEPEPAAAPGARLPVDPDADAKPPPPPAGEGDGDAVQQLRVAVRQALEDEVITTQERGELNRLRKELGIDLDTAVEILNEEKARVEGEPVPEQPPRMEPEPIRPRRDPLKSKPAARRIPITPIPDPKPAPEPVAPPQPAQAKPRPKRVVVDQNALLPGGHRKLATALDTAPEGAEILLKPGIYREQAVLEKAVTLLAEGKPGEAVLESTDEHAVIMKTSHAQIRGLSIRCRAVTPDKKLATIYGGMGDLLLTDCDLASRSYAVALAVGQRAHLTFTKCNLYGASNLGLGCFDSAQATLAECSLYSIGTAAVFAGSGGTARLSGCRLNGSKTFGVMVYSQGDVRLNNCEISANKLAGIEVREGGRIEAQGCRIRGNGRYGVILGEESLGRFEGCDLTGNPGGAWNITMGSQVIRIDNKE